MTKLIINRVDSSLPGSYKERQQQRRLSIQLLKAQRDKNELAVLEAWDAAESFLAGRLNTDDGTPVDEALSLLSSEQFDELWQALSGEESVPQASASS